MSRLIDASRALHGASRAGDTEWVKQLLDDGAPVDEKDEDGWTALMLANLKGHTELVKLLLDKGALLDEKDEDGNTALMEASKEGHTEIVQLLLDKGALVDEKKEYGRTALYWASENGYTEVVRLLLGKGALFDAADARGDVALLGLAGVDEDHVGRMAAQAHRHMLQHSDESDVPASEVATAEATATAVLNLVRLAGSTAARARKLRSSDPRPADDHQVLFGRLQLAAAACLQNDGRGGDVQWLFRSDDGRRALEHAVEIEAKELLAQPVVQGYIKVAWCGELVGRFLDNLGYGWGLDKFFIEFIVILLLQLLFLLPLVALVPALEPWLANELDGLYLLRLPVVKFGLACAADLALALALTIIPAADLATAPVAPLLLDWVGSGLLWEVR